jgi:hypothetical protein
LAQSKDKKANAIVKEMVIAMGGEKNYNAPSFYSMGFCNRKLFWDKWTGDVRVENPNQIGIGQHQYYEGKVYENGVQLTDEKKVNALLEKGKNWWINDAYWLVCLGSFKIRSKLVVRENRCFALMVKRDVLQLTLNGVRP